MFWFDKRQPNTIYIDNNPRSKGISSFRPEFECNPDIVMDFTKLEFADNTFRLVVWDPPHLKRLGKTSEMRKKYGCLNAETWQYDLRKGFEECWRVLKYYGILIFKWNEEDISSSKVLELFNHEPLFGHTTGSKSKTKLFRFMKIPEKTSSSPAPQGSGTSEASP